LQKNPILSNSLKNNTKTVVAVLMMLMIIVGLGFVLASFCLDLGQIAPVLELVSVSMLLLYLLVVAVSLAVNSDADHCVEKAELKSAQN